MAGYIECSKCGVLYKGEHTCKGKEMTSLHPITVEEMRRALEGMLNLIPIMVYEEKETKIFESALYAAKTTMKDPTERRVFVQDFAASLNRKGLLASELVDKFCEHGYTYMEAK